MTYNFRSRPVALFLTLALTACVPWMMGQGCAGGNGIIPLGSDPLTGAVTSPGSQNSTGNVPPSFSFTAPTSDISAEIGAVIRISWAGSDPDSNATVTLMLDPDDDFGNGNERVILPVTMLNTAGGSGFYDLDTIVQNIPQGTYRIVARVNDGINPEILIPAPGQLLLLGTGLLPGNVSPIITVSEPVYNIGVSHGDLVTAQICGRDPDDDGRNPPTTPDIIMMLDFDDDPTNDLDLSGPDAQTVLNQLCQAGSYPVTINGAYVLGCLKDAECGQVVTTPIVDAQGEPVLDADGNPTFNTVVTPGTEFSFKMDVGRIPPRASGEPYRIRATMWDHLNLPVSAYAPGTLSVTALGSGTIDLGKVGRTISGTRFYGFNRGDRAGYAGCDLGDFDGDGAGDFVIVERFGRSYGTANVGSAHVIFGLPPVVDANGKTSYQKFGSEIPLNSITTIYRGALLTMWSPTGDIIPPGSNKTDGLCSVTRIADVTGDEKPEILFGAPYIQSWDDYLDDDPQDKEDLCYFDYYPNPMSTDDGCDKMTGYDWAEGYAGEDSILPCSNDYDLTFSTPIDGGYAIVLSSESNLEYTVLGLDDIGQNQGGGCRWRGAWFDKRDVTQSEYPSKINPMTRFGETVSTMPPMSSRTSSFNSRFGTEMLLSAPMGFDESGMIMCVFGQNWMNFNTGDCASQSFPYYVKVLDCCRAVEYPNILQITGAARGDRLGYAGPAGDFNLDGNQDIVAGAPGATRNGVPGLGIIYVLFGRPDWGGGPGITFGYSGLPDIDLGKANPPRIEVHGNNTRDGFGSMQTIVGDINQDGVADIGFGSGMADGPGGVDSGMVGVIFGGRRLTGENVFTVNQVGTSQLPGAKFYGTQPGGHAGAKLANAGDFNGDGIDDMLISAFDETRTVDGQVRQGVAYLIFGGPHLYNKSFNLSQVGSAELPGMIFVSPYGHGTADAAPIDFVGPAGDVNGDGFADIMLGVSQADFVNPLEPSQRRVDAGEMYLIYGSNVGTNTRGQ